MIYELKNKIPHGSSFLSSEDVLTSTIFGNLRYFSNQCLLIHFLNCAIAPDKTLLKIHDSNIFRINFWKKFYLDTNSLKYNEPDLYLSNKKYDIIIECKYYSFLSEDNVGKDSVQEYTNQLIRYSKIIEKSKKQKIIIYLTNDVDMTYGILDKTKEKIAKDIHLYWLSWRMLYRVMHRFNSNKYNHGEQQLFNDLFNFLRIRKLTVFCGFRIKHIELFYKYRSLYNFIPKDYFNYNTWRYNNEK